MSRVESRSSERSASRYTILGEERSKPICRKAVLRSRLRSSDFSAQRAQVCKDLEKAKASGSINEVAFGEKMREAEARFRLRRLEASMSRGTAREERVEALKMTMKALVQGSSNQCEHGLRRVFRMADRDNSGQLDYEEFRAAVRNYGSLRNLSEGALRTLFDALDIDGDGQISIAEFLSSLNATKLDPKEPENCRRVQRFLGSLAAPAITEPKRIGFEASPPRLALGSLYVGALYEARIEVLNTGDTALRFNCRIKHSSVNLDHTKSAVRIVRKPYGPLPPGLRSLVYLEIHVRAPGMIDLDVLLSSGGDQEIAIPLTAKLIRRHTTDIPTSRQSHDLFQQAFPSIAESDFNSIPVADAPLTSPTAAMQKSVQEQQSSRTWGIPEASVTEMTWANSVSGKPLPTYVRCVTAAQLRRLPKTLAAKNAVWPSLNEQWQGLQEQIAEAASILNKIPPLNECPQDDLESLAVRLQRFECRPHQRLTSGKLKNRILFIASGLVEMQSLHHNDDNGPVAGEIQSEHTVYTVDSSCGRTIDQLSSCAMTTIPIPTLKAPFYTGEKQVLSSADDANEEQDEVLMTESVVQGFSLAYDDAQELILAGNSGLALIRRHMLQRQFESDCQKQGGLIQCNFLDDDFVTTMLEFATSETRHGPKAQFLCRYLRLVDNCESNSRSHDDVTRDGSTTERTLAFDRCLVLADQLWNDFFGEDTKSGKSKRPHKKAALLGMNVVTEARLKLMVALRHKALASADFLNLSTVFEPITSIISTSLDRAFLPDFTKSKQYRNWIQKKFPLDPCSITLAACTRPLPISNTTKIGDDSSQGLLSSRTNGNPGTPSTTMKRRVSPFSRRGSMEASYPQNNDW